MCESLSWAFVVYVLFGLLKVVGVPVCRSDSCLAVVCLFVHDSTIQQTKK